MTELNPYESPQAALSGEGTDTGFDVGRFVGRYLQASAGVSLVSMVASWLVQGQFHFDITFLFIYWAGAGLVRHSRIARQIVIWISAVMIVAALGITVMATMSNVQGLSLQVLGRKLVNPPLAVVLAINVAIILMVAVPFVMLNTSRARREFKKPRNVS